MNSSSFQQRWKHIQTHTAEKVLSHGFPDWFISRTLNGNLNVCSAMRWEIYKVVNKIMAKLMLVCSRNYYSLVLESALVINCLHPCKSTMLSFKLKVLFEDGLHLFSGHLQVSNSFKQLPATRQRMNTHDRWNLLCRKKHETHAGISTQVNTNKRNNTNKQTATTPKRTGRFSCTLRTASIKLMFSRYHTYVKVHPSLYRWHHQ